MSGHCVLSLVFCLLCIEFILYLILLPGKVQDDVINWINPDAVPAEQCEKDQGGGEGEDKEGGLGGRKGVVGVVGGVVGVVGGCGRVPLPPPTTGSSTPTSRARASLNLTQTLNRSLSLSLSQSHYPPHSQNPLDPSSLALSSSSSSNNWSPSIAFNENGHVVCVYNWEKSRYFVSGTLDFKSLQILWTTPVPYVILSLLFSL